MAQEKTDIDNEMVKLVETRLNMQQERQQMEDKETEFVLKIKEKELKIEELTHLLTEEKKMVGLSSPSPSLFLYSERKTTRWTNITCKRGVQIFIFQEKG